MSGAGWLLATVALYLAARRAHARLRTPLASPLLVAPAALVAALAAGHAGYDAYLRGGRWLLALLGPTTVAFALPLHRHRALLREQAAELGAAVLTGSVVAVASSLVLARALGLDPEVARSLAPRSITTPFAMLVARELGGAPALAAVCVILTALVGLVVGPALAAWLPLRSATSRGALLGMGAHGAGAARAMELGAVEGTAAALTMICAGLLLLLAAPGLRWLLHFAPW
ncbi:LrgB family protein [Anaeromyxobacter diazotrophicus]|uniref:LrgB family protein n=1 Tax=Anaeromyxobacter diazotrophicus TaxID=2590199 RepID=A0A7I9VJU8_9BACT|nr:LrgB family protein [Anaeromyxobacter diazotrophicus]GEJ56459.1 hypothetical protein AMYX_12000 [Anaeromyxobacter diazotrophicus]